MWDAKKQVRLFGKEFRRFGYAYPGFCTEDILLTNFMKLWIKCNWEDPDELIFNKHKTLVNKSISKHLQTALLYHIALKSYGTVLNCFTSMLGIFPLGQKRCFFASGRKPPTCSYKQSIKADVKIWLYIDLIPFENTLPAICQSAHGKGGRNNRPSENQRHWPPDAKWYTVGIQAIRMLVIAAVPG